MAPKTRRVRVGFLTGRTLLPFYANSARRQLLPFYVNFRLVTFTILSSQAKFCLGALHAPLEPSPTSHLLEALLHLLYSRHSAAAVLLEAEALGGREVVGSLRSQSVIQEDVCQ